LSFGEEVRFFTEQWMQLVYKGTMSKVPLEEVESEFLKAVGLGLSYDPSKGQAFCIAYFDDSISCYRPRFYIGYKGMHHLLMMNPKTGMTHTQLVYEHDQFDDKGPTHVPKHKRCHKTSERGDVLCGYAYTYYGEKDSVLCTIVSNDVIQAIAEQGIQSGSQAWASAFSDEMRKKTVTRRHFSELLPLMNLNVVLDPSNYQDASYSQGIM
jgi:recombinational DNA repair protein RecT